MEKDAPAQKHVLERYNETSEVLPLRNAPVTREATADRLASPRKRERKRRQA